MKLIGTPFTIDGTDQGWLVTWPDAVKHGALPEQPERISFTVLLPRRADLTIAEVQTFAMKRAEELLRQAIRAAGQSPHSDTSSE